MTARLGVLQHPRQSQIVTKHTRTVVNPCYTTVLRDTLLLRKGGHNGETPQSITYNSAQREVLNPFANSVAGAFSSLPKLTAAFTPINQHLPPGAHQ